MDNRRYNIFFHLHTVSGIGISLLLFVIFFCGAFTLFREELYTWETTQPSEEVQHFHQEPMATYLHQLLKRSDIISGSRLSVSLEEEGREVRLSALAGGKDEAFRTDTSGRKLPPTPEYTGAVLLYWLHFFWQFGRWGYSIAGAVSLLFFLAICTGIWIHWGKLRSNFFRFRVGVKPKQLWTDLHTALGVIGLPFQFLYALTGSMFGLGILIVLVGSNTFYKGNNSAFYDEVFPYYSQTGGTTAAELPDLPAIFAGASAKQPDVKWEKVEIHRLLTDSCYILFQGTVPSKQKIAGKCVLVFDTKGKLLYELDPSVPNYLQTVPQWMVSWHYADFRLSGWTRFMVKICWFVLALTGCTVIVSGMLIWEKAREKKKLPPGKLHFSKTLVRLFLSVAYAFLPAVPVILGIQRVANRDIGEFSLNLLFVSVLLACTVWLWFLPDHRDRFRVSLTCMFAMLLPMPFLTRIFTGYTFIAAGSSQSAHLFYADLFWIFLIAASGLSLFWWNKRIVKNPVDRV